jgi:hypothetical protein
VTGVEGGEQVAPETEPLRRDAAAITQQDDQHTEKPDIQMDEPVPAQKLPRGGRAKTNVSVITTVQALIDLTL